MLPEPLKGFTRRLTQRRKDVKPCNHSTPFASSRRCVDLSGRFSESAPYLRRLHRRNA